MDSSLKIIFIFVDGFGIGSTDSDINPLCDPRFPTLGNMLSNAVPLDACLGVQGLPQSATGQATLLTGINAPRAMGRHIEGFPPPSLKKLIEHENLFSKLRNIGKHCTFANCYLNIDPHHIPPRRQSVTTVMTLSALGRVRGTAELLAGKAVTHDITRRTMHTRGYDGPLITPEAAAEHLIDTAEENDFTLFEHFLTDQAGHSGTMEKAFQCLEILERFIARAVQFAERSNHLFILSSDHGNIEDLSVRTHTRNPVPLVAIGDRGHELGSLVTLADVTPALVDLYASCS
jgi:2,3-bisphosphoglycerate-independent phosphoglycerate mutase